jgi:predicted DNA-binding protein YlxM (UPF0122 family)
MAEQDMLAKTNRVNLLFDFYRSLLTDKQQTFLQLYFHEDFSLGEIAESYEVSRQAVYEHIKRAEQMLEDYEGKLHLLQQHDERQLIVQECIERLKPASIEGKEHVLALLYKLGGDPDGI